MTTRQATGDMPVSSLAKACRRGLLTDSLTLSCSGHCTSTAIWPSLALK